MHYEVEYRTAAGNWRPVGVKYSLLNNAKLQATALKDRASVVRIVRVADDGLRMVVEE